VLVKQALIEALAERIERAYRRRRSVWLRAGSSAGVWSTAAALLVELHQHDPTLPLDPELFVAVQSSGLASDDPWMGLTQPSSARCYRSRVHTMIRSLRAELRAEVRWAERRIARGESLDNVLSRGKKRISALSSFIIAIRSGNLARAAKFRCDAVLQHRSCPLYRPASAQLLPPDLYPVRERSIDEELVAMTRQLAPLPHLN
jgi:hypothetical protein